MVGLARATVLSRDIITATPRIAIDHYNVNNTILVSRSLLNLSPALLERFLLKDRIHEIPASALITRLLRDIFCYVVQLMIQLG